MTIPQSIRKFCKDDYTKNQIISLEELIITGERNDFI